jgi:hypothetical protein
LLLRAADHLRRKAINEPGRPADPQQDTDRIRRLAWRISSKIFIIDLWDETAFDQ